MFVLLYCLLGMNNKKNGRQDHADRIKVAVIEGDYADLCSLGLPRSLGLRTTPATGSQTVWGLVVC